MLWDILILSMERRLTIRDVLFRVSTAGVMVFAPTILSRSVVQAEGVDAQGSRKAVQKAGFSSGCGQLASERTNGRYWNPMTERYENIPWFKVEGDMDPHNRNITIQAENVARRRCDLPLLEMVNLSSTNPDVDLTSGFGSVPPLVRGMRFRAYL